MSTSQRSIEVPAPVQRKLQEVQRRETFLRFLSGATSALSAFLAVMLAAMLIDWMFTLFSTSLRVTLTAVAVGAGALLLLSWGVRPLLERFRLKEVARNVDQAIPQLEERWSTVTELSDTDDPPEIRGADAMIRQVTREAEDLEREVTPHAVTRTEHVLKSLYVLGGIAAVLLLVMFYDWQQTSVLLQRFWRPTANISITDVTAVSGDVTVGEGEPLHLEALVENRAHDVALLFVRDSRGGIGEPLKLYPSNKGDGSFEHEWAAVDESFDYRFRSGDGQTPWHSVTVVERPRIAAIDFRITPPEYSKLPTVEEQGLPRKVRALEQSRLEVSFQSSIPLKRFDLQLGKDRQVSLTADEEGRYHYSTALTEPLMLSPLLTSDHDLTNERPPKCNIVVYRDKAPSIKISSPNDEIAVRPDDKVAIEFSAKDDFGIRKAELVVYDGYGADAKELKVIEVPIPETGANEEITGETELDLKEFDVKHGSELSYAMRVYDTKDTMTDTHAAEQHEPAPQAQQADAQSAESGRSADSADQQDSQVAQAESASGAQQDSNQSTDQPPGSNQANSQPQDSDPTEANPPNKDAAAAQANAQNQQSEQQPAANQPNQQSTQKQQAKPSSSSSGGNQQSPPAKQDEQNQRRSGELAGAPKPPDKMTRRALDVGQPCMCKPMRLTIDEWAGSFAGQAREKLQLEIDPFLKRLIAELTAAEKTVSPLVAGNADAAWSDDDEAAKRQTDNHLVRGEEVIVKLREKSADTPYAFIGLQLIDIGQTHVGPARDHLGKVTAEAEDRSRNLERTRHHIRRAVEMVEQLNRRYELVKLNEKLDEKMVHVKKMHQLFIEGTFALLKSKRPNLNPKSRKFLEFEVDEEYLKKLQELLDKKRNIQAELAKILAEDPRLLRRYMARAQLQADSLRDQLTLLALEQRSLSDEVAAWEKAGGEDRRKLAEAHLKARQVAAAAKIVEESAKMLDNYVTWTPLDLEVAEGKLGEMREAATKIATTARQFAGAVADDQSQQAAKSAKELHRLLTEFEQRLPEVMDDHPEHDLLAVHVTNRLAEVSKLITRSSGWVYQAEKISDGKFHLAAEVEQHRIAVETAKLGVKIQNLDSWLAGMNFEVQEAGRALLATMAEELIPDLMSAQMALKENQLKRTVELQAHGVESFAKAEEQMDLLMDLIIKDLDSRPVNTKLTGDPQLADPSLDDLLRALEREALAMEGLGIPGRPNNLQIEKDWLKPSNNPGGGGSGQAGGAMAQSQAARRQLERTQKKLRRANRALKQEGKRSENQQARRDRIRWNTLASQLEDKLRQGRGHTPPEQYRRAIERYFEVITEDEGASREE